MTVGCFPTPYGSKVAIVRGTGTAGVHNQSRHYSDLSFF